jgi:hypothetical protein
MTVQKFQSENLTGRDHLKEAKPDRKRSLKRGKLRMNDNIKMDLKEIGWEGVELIHLAQKRVQ